MSFERLPKGMDTDLGQGGVKCVRRAEAAALVSPVPLLKKPKVLIFDDSTSAVDTATEGEIARRGQKLTDVTKIIIAQRITSVMDTDKLSWMTVAESMVRAPPGAGKDSIYQEIYASQMKGEED